MYNHSGYAGTGASSRSNPSAFSSAQSSAGMGETGDRHEMWEEYIIE